MIGVVRWAWEAPGETRIVLWIEEAGGWAAGVVFGRVSCLVALRAAGGGTAGRFAGPAEMDALARSFSGTGAVLCPEIARLTRADSDDGMGAAAGAVRDSMYVAESGRSLAGPPDGCGDVAVRSEA